MDETITIYVGKINENGYVRTFKCKKSSVSGPYFDMLIKNSKNRTLRLPSILPEAFKYVVDTLDRPRASLVFETLEDALITYSMCDMMLLTRSKDMCLQDVKRKLFDVDNALRILNINAMTINDRHISNLAWRKIRFRPNDILKSGLLKELETRLSRINPGGGQHSKTRPTRGGVYKFRTRRGGRNFHERAIHESSFSQSALGLDECL